MLSSWQSHCDSSLGSFDEYKILQGSSFRHITLGGLSVISYSVCVCQKLWKPVDSKQSYCKQNIIKQRKEQTQEQKKQNTE